MGIIWYYFHMATKITYYKNEIYKIWFCFTENSLYTCKFLLHPLHLHHTFLVLHSRNTICLNRYIIGNNNKHIKTSINVTSTYTRGTRVTWTGYAIRRRWLHGREAPVQNCTNILLGGDCSFHVTPQSNKIARAMT